MKDILIRDTLLEFDCHKKMARILEVVETSKNGEKSQYSTNKDERNEWIHSAPGSEEDIIENYMCNYKK